LLPLPIPHVFLLKLVAPFLLNPTSTKPFFVPPTLADVYFSARTVGVTLACTAGGFDNFVSLPTLFEVVHDVEPATGETTSLAPSNTSA
jgi:hypothetical protein